MNGILKIFQIDSNQDFIELSEVNENEVKDFGNGFFISNNGYLASVAHVLTDKDLNSFALYGEKLQKIKIVERIFTEKDENHLDVAIGKLNVSQIDYFDPLNFERVAEGAELQLIGYSRILNSNEHSDNNDNADLSSSFNKLQGLCLKVEYPYSKDNDIILMQNSFTIILNQTDLYGMSGSPVINKNNNVVGVFKSGSKIGSKLKGQAIHIDTISRIFNKYFSNS